MHALELVVLSIGVCANHIHGGFAADGSIASLDKRESSPLREDGDDSQGSKITIRSWSDLPEVRQEMLILRY